MMPEFLIAAAIEWNEARSACTRAGVINAAQYDRLAAAEAALSTAVTEYKRPPAPDPELVQRPWGYMAGDEFRPLPKQPLEMAGKVPPCDVEMPDGSIRHVIEAPR